MLLHAPDWRAAATVIVNELRTFAATLDIAEYLLFTIVGALITPEETTIFQSSATMLAR